jgi:hypothetical protein
MAPLKPHWTQPSHPDFLKVIVSDNEAEFTSKSVSTSTVAPFAVVAKLCFPPCTLAGEPAYSTVQIGRDRHLELNSDLLYLNHSCEPSLVSLYHPPSKAIYTGARKSLAHSQIGRVGQGEGVDDA